MFDFLNLDWIIETIISIIFAILLETVAQFIKNFLLILYKKYKKNFFHLTFNSLRSNIIKHSGGESQPHFFLS